MILVVVAFVAVWAVAIGVARVIDPPCRCARCAPLEPAVRGPYAHRRGVGRRARRRGMRRTWMHPSRDRGGMR